VRPAEGAVAGVDPEFAHLGGGDVGDVGELVGIPLLGASVQHATNIKPLEQPESRQTIPQRQPYSPANQVRTDQSCRA
jgi:hypothetical protein